MTKPKSCGIAFKDQALHNKRANFSSLFSKNPMMVWRTSGGTVDIEHNDVERILLLAATMVFNCVRGESGSICHWLVLMSIARL